MTAPTVADVTRDPYVLLTACLTFHKLPPELRKAIKECVDARGTDLLTRLTDLGERFQGIDIQFRRTRPIGWEGTWRIRVLASKNERYDYRVAAFGDSFNATAIATLAAIPESSLAILADLRSGKD